MIKRIIDFFKMLGDTEFHWWHGTCPPHFIVYNAKINIESVAAVARQYYVLVKYPKERTTKYLINHERIHIAQQWEFNKVRICNALNVIFPKLFPYKHQGTSSDVLTRWEFEAYANERDDEYLYKRKPDNWRNKDVVDFGFTKQEVWFFRSNKEVIKLPY